MFRNLFANMTPVVKNLLLINVVMFIATGILPQMGINLTRTLGAYYPGSSEFHPYQIVTHMFMHGGFMHILFNMFGLIIFGPQLEKVWGPKKFLIFYISCGLGALGFSYLVEFIQIRKSISEYGLPVGALRDLKNLTSYGFVDGVEQGLNDLASKYNVSAYALLEIYRKLMTPMVGASGALYGVLLGFGMLFPNTIIMLIFPPIPIKAKFMVIILGAIALISGLQNNVGDNVAHFAHLGGMLFGFILIKIWQKNRTDFY